MATFNTAQYNLQKPTRDNISRNAPTGVSDGAIEFAVIPYAVPSPTDTMVAGDIINLCILPAGFIPIPELSKIVCESDPGTMTVDVGTAADTDGWLDGLTLSSGGELSAISGTLPAWLTTKTPLVADTGSGNAVVRATIATCTLSTANAVIQFVLAYKRGY